MVLCRLKVDLQKAVQKVVQRGDLRLAEALLPHLQLKSDMPAAGARQHMCLVFHMHADAAAAALNAARLEQQSGTYKVKTPVKTNQLASSSASHAPPPFSPTFRPGPRFPHLFPVERMPERPGSTCRWSYPHMHIRQPKIVSANHKGAAVGRTQDWCICRPNPPPPPPPPGCMIMKMPAAEARQRFVPDFHVHLNAATAALMPGAVVRPCKIAPLIHREALWFAGCLCGRAFTHRAICLTFSQGTPQTCKIWSLNLLAGVNFLADSNWVQKNPVLSLH